MSRATQQQRRSRGGRKQHGPRQQPSEQASRNEAQSAPASAAHAPRKAPAARATQCEVLAAVRSLYEDQLKPYGRILRKRLVEQSVATGQSVSQWDVDAKHLREVCEACDALRTEPGEGGEWSTVLRDVQPTFVDLYSNADPYPEEFWEAVATFFNGPEWVEASLPGGRYSCAQSLVGQKLDFLSGYSLGQVCHIVQLAISTRRVLGYRNGATVPYYRSQSMLKQSCAESQRPCTAGLRADSDMPELPFASWQTVQEHVQHILVQAHAAGQDSISISNVKGLFRSECRVELSETKLGHHRLTDLLRDERLRGICTLQLRDQGYVVVAQQAAAKPVPATPAGDARSSAVEMLEGQEVAARSEPRRVIFCPDEPLCLDDAESGSTPAAARSMAVDALHTPAAETPASQAAATPMFSPLTAFFGDGVQRRKVLAASSSLPLFHAYAASRDSARISSLGATAPSVPEAAESDADSSPIQLESQELAARRVVFCPDEPLCLDDAESGSAAAVAEAVVGGAFQTPVIHSPATEMAATPMFSPATVFFGDGLQRQKASHRCPATSLLTLCAGGAVPISLDSVLFRSGCEAEPSETKLTQQQYTDMSQDVPLSDTLALQLQDQGCPAVTQQAEARRVSEAPEGEVECSAVERVAADADQGRPRRMVFCPDEPLCLDEEDFDAAAAVAGAVVVEAPQTPAAQTPATPPAATPMFSPSTAFFGDGLQRRGALPGLLPTACLQDGFMAMVQQHAQLALSLGFAPDSNSGDCGASMQRLPTAPYYPGCMPGSLPFLVPPCPPCAVSASYVDAR